MRISVSDVAIGAPRQTVWAVLAEPQHVKSWQFGSVLETDWTVGSPVRFTVEWEGNVFEQWGEVLLVDEARELRYSLSAPRPGLVDSPENRFTMIYALSDVPTGTLLTITRRTPGRLRPTMATRRSRRIPFSPR